MKRLGALTIAVAMTVAACGGSNDSSPEPDVEVEAVEEGGVREAGDDVLVLNGCRFEPNTQCPGANLNGVTIPRAKLSGANLRGAKLEAADLFAADLSNADLSNAALGSSWLTWADLRGANLDGADLEGADLEGAMFCNTIMPDGSVQNGNC